MIESRLYVFGGYNSNGFLPADLEILELGSLCKSIVDGGTATMLNK